jgi:Protein of unknown function (DUF3761)
MEPTPQPQEPTQRDNWFDRHKVVTCFSIVALFALSLAFFHHHPQEVAVEGASTSIAPTATATPTQTPSDTPTPTVSPSPTPTASPLIKALIPQSTIQATQPITTQEQGLSNNNYYTNSSGNEVHSPANTNDGSVPAGATAKCSDGTYSFSQHRSGTCSHHGGVAQWL